MWEYRAIRRARVRGPRTFGGETRYARVESVYDGDTVTVTTKLDSGERAKQYKLRLAGVDAPELRPLKTTPHRELHVAAARAVTARLAALLPKGTMVRIEFDPEDKYGRLLGTVHTLRRSRFGWRLRNDVNVSQWLIDAGMALPYGGGTKRKFEPSFLQRIVTFTEERAP